MDIPTASEDRIRMRLTSAGIFKVTVEVDPVGCFGGRPGRIMIFSLV